MTSALFLLRAKEIGLSLEELDLLTVGAVVDLIVEKSNDHFDYPQQMTQGDIDKFFN